MTAPGQPPPVRRWSAWTPLSVSLAVVGFLATIGSFGVGFGLMTNCTNTYSCTATGCPPCETTEAWLVTGWIGQGLLLAGGVVLVVLAARRVRLRTVRTAALVLAPLSIGLIVVTTVLAERSY